MSETPYRENEPPAPEPADPEHEAIALIAKRTRRIRGLTVVASFFVGIAASGALYQFFWDYYESRGRMIPVKLLIIACVTLGLIPALIIGPRLSSFVIKLRRNAWLDSLAKDKGLDREQLEEMTRSFLG